MYKTVYKYGTGDEIPEGAIYLTTLVENVKTFPGQATESTRLVWHYFLVAVGAKK